MIVVLARCSPASRMARVPGPEAATDRQAVLYLSVPTVKTHVSAILAKLGLNNRVQVALLVHDAGLIDDQD